MKLYATVSSERASKGQGGNEYLNIELKVHDGETPIGFVELYLNEDTENGCELDEWILNYYRYEDSENPKMIAQGHAKPKAKKLKAEKIGINNVENLNKILGDWETTE